jgi:predicted lipid-binding transport protein (Tim44 family)
MGDGFQILDIILFALVAGFLILRLRSVLGRRDGHQGRVPGPFTPPGEAERNGEKVVRLPERGDRPSEAPAPNEPAASPLESGVAQVRAADPNFDLDEFLSGARIAFELILNAFAAGDSEALKPLLSPEVFGNFDQSIRERLEAKQRLETKIVSLNAVELVEAYMTGRTAHVTVKFVSEQISALYDAAGSVVEGDPVAITEATDFWTFARDTRSADPNWTLVATGTLE